MKSNQVDRLTYKILTMECHTIVNGKLRRVMLLAPSELAFSVRKFLLSHTYIPFFLLPSLFLYSPENYP